MATIAVDFDGVIHAYSRGWDDGSIYDEPLPGALDAVLDLQSGAAVFIFTTRDARSVAAWLTDRGIPACTDAEAGSPVFWNEQGRVLVTPRKLPAVAYIDDRAVRFESWPQALNALATLGYHR